MPTNNQISHELVKPQLRWTLVPITNDFLLASMDSWRVPRHNDISYLPLRPLKRIHGEPHHGNKENDEHDLDFDVLFFWFRFHKKKLNCAKPSSSQFYQIVYNHLSISISYWYYK